MILKVMTYNTRRLGDESIVANQWRFRKEKIFDMINKHAPDILCLQEDHPDQIKEILSILKGYDFFGFYNEDAKLNIPGETNSIIFKNSISSLIDKNHFWLSDSPNVQSKFKGQSKYLRTVTYLKLRIDEDDVCVFNTHFDHLSKEIQKKEAIALSKIVDKINPGKYVLCGDFNCDINSPQVKLLMNKFNLINNNVSDKTVIDWSGVHPPRNCIDFIFSNLGLKKVIIDNSTYLSVDGINRTPSDHLPIISELIL